SLREDSRFQIRVDVLLLHVDVVIFGKSRRAVVEPVGRQRSADEYPFAEAGRQFDFSVRQKDRGRALSLGGKWSGGACPEAGTNQPDSSDGEQVLVHHAISLWFEHGPCTCCSLRAENRITLDVNPVGVLCRDVAAEAVFLEVSGNLRIGRVGLEKRPSPPVAPE